VEVDTLHFFSVIFEYACEKVDLQETLMSIFVLIMARVEELIEFSNTLILSSLENTVTLVKNTLQCCNVPTSYASQSSTAANSYLTTSWCT
jgi:hypothetical protein